LKSLFPFRDHNRTFKVSKNRLIKTAVIITAAIVMVTFGTVKTVNAIQNKMEKHARETKAEEKARDIKQADAKLKKLILDFEEDNDVDSDSIAVSYYNFDTGVTYTQNGSAQMTAASTYKLPLNMYMYDLIAKGKITKNTKLTFTSSSYADDYGIVSMGYSVGDSISLGTLMESSIVNSDNNASLMMINYLGGWSDYVADIQKYSDEDADKADYDNNNIRVNYMMDVLRYLYKNSSDYSELLANMKKACSGKYLQKYVDVKVAHKYGNYDTAQNDTGIVYADSPYAVAIYTDGVTNAEDLIGRLNKKLLEFTNDTVAKI